MDLERAMEFMLEQQAQMQAREAEMQARQAEMQTQQAAAKKEHDEQMAELRQWLIRGAKMLAVQRAAGEETDRRISALVEAQQGTDQRMQELRDSHLATELSLRETQASLKAFLDSMRRSGNGH